MNLISFDFGLEHSVFISQFDYSGIFLQFLYALQYREHAAIIGDLRTCKETVLSYLQVDKYYHSSDLRLSTEDSYQRTDECSTYQYCHTKLRVCDMLLSGHDMNEAYLQVRAFMLTIVCSFIGFEHQDFCFPCHFI